MANTCEPLLSRREKQHAKGADRHGPKGGQSGRRAWRSLRAEVGLPAVRRSLSPSVSGTRAERGKPKRSHRDVESRPQGCACGRVGMGGRKKRMPVGNRPDRGSSFALSRKGADFRLVLDREKGTERLNRCGYFRRCVLSAALKARRALRVSPVQTPIVKVTVHRLPGASRRLIKA